MEVNEFQLVPHLLLLHDLVGRLDNLPRKSSFLALIFLDQGPFLSVFLLEKLLNPFGLDVTCAAILPSH